MASSASSARAAAPPRDAGRINAIATEVMRSRRREEAWGCREGRREDAAGGVGGREAGRFVHQETSFFQGSGR